MKQVYVIRIITGSNSGEFLIKYSKGYSTSKKMGLQNLFHSKTIADREAKRYVHECETAKKNLKLLNSESELLKQRSGASNSHESVKKYYKEISLRGITYNIITYNLIKEEDDEYGLPSPLKGNGEFASIDKKILEKLWPKDSCMKYLRYDAYRGIINMENLFKHTELFVLNSVEELEKDIRDNYVGHDDYPARLRYNPNDDTITEFYAHNKNEFIHYRDGRCCESPNNNTL